MERLPWNIWVSPMLSPGFFFFLIIFKLINFCFWLCWVFISARGLSLVAASGGPSSSLCAGLSLSRPLLLRSTGSRRAGSVVVVHGPSRSAACGIFQDQGSNPCPLHWQADSQPLRHQGSPQSPGFLSERGQESLRWSWRTKMQGWKQSLEQCALMMEEGVMSQEKGEPLKLEKARKQVFPWSLQKEGRPTGAFILAQ